MRDLVFLPDRDGRDTLTDAMGFVRCGADEQALAGLAERLRAPEGAAAGQDDTLWRGLLCLALLMDMWQDCGAELTLLTIDQGTSPFAAMVLASRPAAERGEPVRLLLLEKNGKRRLLGIADAACGLRLPATRSDLTEVVPERAGWIDRETGAVSDPVPYLNERDRAILLSRMALLALDTPQAAALTETLRQADEAETEAVCRKDEDALERLAIRVEAMHGLKDFEAFAEEKAAYCKTGCNPLMQCLAGQDADLHAELGDIRTCRWNGVPFAQTSSKLGLTGVPLAEDGAVLAQIAQELSLMSGSSVRWNHDTAASLRQWLADAGSLIPQARERIEASCRVMTENGRQVQTTITLTWPWDAASGAVRALLEEALGEGWMQAAASPFADRLTKLTGHVLGDNVLQACCACADGVLLPPLSRKMAGCVAAAAEGEGLAPDTVRFQPQEDGGITASFLLRARGEVRMVRSYGVDEILVLGEEDSPGVAVWPCLPMAAWRAYHVFSRGKVEVAALCGGTWKAAFVPLSPAEETADASPAEAGWRCLRVTEYPACLSLTMEGLCLGALPNMLPAFHAEKNGAVVAAIDLGSSETAVAFAFGGQPQVLEGQALTRQLVMPQAEGEDSFLNSLTPASVVPTAVVVTGPGEELFTDGYAYRPASLEALARQDAQTLRTALKWRSDSESVRARKLLLHQVMLGASLTAALAGAESIAWRVAIADEMGDEGREAMLGMMNELSLCVADETGLPLTKGAAPVAWAEESAALNTCLRNEGSGRGSYAALDLGGGSTKLQLWLQGQQKPVAGAVLLEGLQSLLVSALKQQPQRLLDDFADCGDEALLQGLLTLCAQLPREDAAQRQTDKAALMLDQWLAAFCQPVAQHMSNRLNQQRPTWMQSVLLETAAALVFTVGLMLRQACDDPMISHRLPDDLPVCITGRGAWLLESLTPQMRSGLQHLARKPLRIDHPVRFVTLRTAALPAQSVALGLAAACELEQLSAAPPIRTRESFSGLMRMLMQQLCVAYPQQMWLLHEGLFDWQGGLTPAGEEAIRRIASRCYGDGEDIPASVMDFVRTLRETPVQPAPVY